MTKCPLISYNKQCYDEVNCMGENCMLWSMNRDTCLIRLALLQHAQGISSGREETVEEKIKSLESQIKTMGKGLPLMIFNDTVEKDWSGLQGGL